jgi:5-methylcytosine-specific restriction enzyme subunit McrC
MLWVSEHGRIRRGDSSEALEYGDLQLRKTDFDALLELLDESVERGANLEPVLRYSRESGRDVLVVQRYAGVIRTESGCQIEILPKISKHMDAHTSRKLLVKMLMEINEPPFKVGTLAALEAHDMPLFELLIWQFLEHVGDIVRKGIARAYVDQTDNLVFLRGKLELSRHIRVNAYDRSRLYCAFDEFEMDRPINRLIKGALEIVDRLTGDATNWRRCREFLFWFDRAKATNDPGSDFRAIQNDRLIQHYAPAMPTCRLILERLNPLTDGGDRRAIAMLFPMDQIFESYVTSRLRRQLHGWKVAAKVRSQALVEEHSGKPIFTLEPDIELTRGQERVIADTKWKLLDGKDRANNYGMAQADAYQLFAYCRKYLAAQEPRRVILIYPRTSTFRQPLPPFWYQPKHEVLYVLPYDLERDELMLGEDIFAVRHDDVHSGARTGS